jgi:predicted outer membrane lipoprotein
LSTLLTALSWLLAWLLAWLLLPAAALLTTLWPHYTERRTVNASAS